MVGAGERTTEVADDTGRNGQPKAQADAGFLGRKERLEQARQCFGAQAGAVIPHVQAHHRALGRAADIHGWAGMLGHGVERIADQIDDDLFQPVGVAQRVKRIVRKIGCDLGAAGVQALFKNGDGMCDDLADIDGPWMPAGFARKRLQLSGDQAHAVDQ